MTISVVPGDVDRNPVIVGHEFSAEVVEVGVSLRSQYQPGQRVSLQPALKGTYDAAGYTFPNIGGDATYAIIPAIYIEQGNVLPYEGDAFFLRLPVRAALLRDRRGACLLPYDAGRVHRMIWVFWKAAFRRSSRALARWALPMIDYMVHRERRSGKIVVTDIDDARLAHAQRILSPQEAANHGVELIYLNTRELEDPVAELKRLSGKNGYDEVFIFAPVPAVIRQGDAILGYDGCLNFFAGPTDPAFAAPFNFYNVHYNATHVVGTSGGNTDDMREALKMAGQNQINPAILVTHIGGLDAAKDTILNLPNVPGGKKTDLYAHQPPLDRDR